MAYTGDPSTHEVEVGGPRVQVTLGYMRPCLEMKEENIYLISKLIDDTEHFFINVYLSQCWGT